MGWIRPPPAGPPRDGPGSVPSDIGLAGERTMLAWARLGIALIGLPMGILGYAVTDDVLAALGALVAAGLGLGLLVLSVRRQRVVPDMLARGATPLATGQVLATSACVLALAVACLFLTFD